MSPDTILLLVGVLFAVLLVGEIPVAWALACAGGVGIFLLRDEGLVDSVAGSAPYDAVASYSLAIIPMYILMGMFALHGNLAERVYSMASVAFRRLPGGLGVATVGACAGFAAVTGSSVATAATIGRLSIGEMRRYGYPAPFAAGIVAAAGTLGVLIPPSVIIVIYGILAQESIAQLLVAGIVPGILTAVMFAGWILICARWVLRSETPAGVLDRELVLAGTGSATVSSVAGGDNPASNPASTTAAGSSVEEGRSITRWQGIRAVVWVSIIFAVVIAGVYSGLFTVIESGAMGAVVALTMLVVESAHEGGRQVVRRMYQSMLDTAGTSSMAFGILIGATVLTTFLVMARVPSRFTEWIVGFGAPPIVVVLLLLAALIPLGMALESMSILIVTVPLMHPVVTELGYDGIWWAILVVKMIEIGMITPPVGMNVFVVSGASGVPVERVFRGALPFVLVDLACVGLLVAFPDLITWLPSMVSD